MNLGAHIVVARRLVDNDPGYWLGAALPDIASMGGFRLLGSTPNDRMTAGIAMHHRTDEAFHHHRWFNDIQIPLRNELVASGLARGPARAVAHVGPELLLDEWLLDQDPRSDAIDATNAALAQLRGPFDTFAHLVRTEHRQQWRDHLDRVAGWEPGGGESPGGTRRPAKVAAQLQRMLQRRPRLAFDVDQLDLIARHLAPVSNHIGSTYDEFLTDLVAQLDQR